MKNSNKDFYFTTTAVIQTLILVSLAAGFYIKIVGLNSASLLMKTPSTEHIVAAEDPKLDLKKETIGRERLFLLSLDRKATKISAGMSVVLILLLAVILIKKIFPLWVLAVNFLFCIILLLFSLIVI